MFKKIRDHWLFFLFLTAYFIFVAFRLIKFPTPFFDWDESIYMQTGREMLQQKSYFVPLWQGKIWLDKPPLIPLLYISVANIFSFLTLPEISTRIFTLIIACITLTFVYFFYLKIIKDKKLATLIAMITCFTPIFFQRSQVVNLDVFLLLGWLGYFYFFENFWLSFIFLSIAVFSKSLIGFYPTVIMFGYYLYLFFRKKINSKKLKPFLKKIFFQIMMLLCWYLIMLLIFGKDFWIQHIVESHFRRVSSSIEFHFGQRTFYLTLAFEQLQFFALSALVGTVILFYQIIIKNNVSLLPYLFFVPWYLFLNLTKTKIFWYFFSSIPQLAALALYPLTLFRKKKVIYYFLLLATFGYLIFTISKSNILKTNFSKEESYYYLSLYAGKHCSELDILLNPTTRNSFATLENMGLLITTTKWWGSHPSIMYYFGKKVNLFYDKNEFINNLNKTSDQPCFVTEKDDLDIWQNKNFQLLKQFEEYYLYIK